MYHIFHSATTHFSIWDRIKILFGKPLQIDFKIETGDENVVVVATKTDVWVDTVFRKTPKIVYSHTPCDGNCGMNYCDDNGCIERKRVLTDYPYPPGSDKLECS